MAGGSRRVLDYQGGFAEGGDRGARKTNLDKECFLGPDESRISEEEMDTLNMMLYVKDRFNVSGGAYHEMAQLCKEMSRHYKPETANCQTQHTLEHPAYSRRHMWSTTVT